MLVATIHKSGKSQGHDRFQPPETDITRIVFGVVERSNLADLAGRSTFSSNFSSDLGISVHNGGSARGYLGVGGHLSIPGMADWVGVCAVYLHIAILGATVRICSDEGVLDRSRHAATVGPICTPARAPSVQRVAALTRRFGI